MKVAIVGGSASGIYTALLLKAQHPEWEVTIFEHEMKLAKKLYATGNGHCNLLHDHPSAAAYSQPLIIAEALKRYPFSRLLEQFQSWGIALKRVDDLYYPASFSAPAFVHYLECLLKESGVRTVLSTNVRDYFADEGGVVLCGEKFDALVLAAGGKSGKNLGSDGSLFPVLEKHGYRISPLRPGLCPIRTEEHFPSLNGYRHEARVAISVNGASFEEEGEVLFKKDGLSGIVIFNAESFLAHINAGKGTPIHLDFFPHVEGRQWKEEWAKAAKRPFYLGAYFPQEMQSVLEKLTKGQPDKTASLLKDWVFHFESTYPFEDSQVTLGGVDWQCVDASALRSKIEPHVFFAGEILDMAGYCGGYNLTWCLLSALMLSEAIA